MVTATKETGLLRKAENTSAFLKCGILGFSGTGKTYLATEMAVGLHKHLKSKKPVAFLDTENGSDYSIPRFDQAKIQLITAKTRAFSDLLKIVQEAEQKCSILIIDSISHFWTELQQAYMTKKKINRMLFQHWLPVKTEWRRFTDVYLNSKLHIILCGRAGWEYDLTEDEEGKKELVKTGTKMRVETELGYEPSLLLEIERMKIRPANTKSEIEMELMYRTYVLKDRADKINGKYFDNAVFENFLPHINFLNIGGKHLAVDTTRTSEALFDSNGSGWERQKKKEIALEEIKNELLKRWDNRSRPDQLCKVECLKQVFLTGSWKAVEGLPVEHLEKGLKMIKQIAVQDIETIVTQQIQKEEKEKPKEEKSKTKKEVKKNV